MATPRVVRFALVGGIGVAVQLAVLAALTAIKVNYLLATALAVEAAVLHNFAWHQRFTWADRSAPSNMVKRLFLFHCSNGVISIAGNLLLMRGLVGLVGLPVLIANVLTIATCAWANFAASDLWVFAKSTVVAEPSLGDKAVLESGP